MSRATAVEEQLGLKKHFILRGDGAGGWRVEPAEYRMISGTGDGHLMPYGVAQMDNGEVILVAGMEDRGEYRCVYSISTDRGESWSEMRDTGAYGRPLTCGYLGGGDVLLANELLGKPEDDVRQLRMYVSSDYGRTWTPRRYPLTTADGRSCTTTEGTVFAETDPNAGTMRLCHLSLSHDSNDWARDVSRVYIRWSDDLGASWYGELCPESWRYQEQYKGTTVDRGVSEGSIIRAKNGWLVAALRTDLPTRYWDVPYDDSLEGLGVSVSRDNGKTWSAVSRITDAGRHHPNLVLMPDGTLVMTIIVRADVQNRRLVSYRRGCEALVSRDHGLTWDTAGGYVLDAYEFVDKSKWYDGVCGHIGSTLLSDGSLLAVYGNYLAKSAALIRWHLSD